MVVFCLRSNWLPFYRPYSFASQSFDCFAENIQFRKPFLQSVGFLSSASVLRSYIITSHLPCQHFATAFFKIFPLSVFDSRFPVLIPIIMAESLAKALPQW